MAVVLETTIGDITIDLFVKERPKTCLNFLKLCKIKYYNFNLFHSVQHNFLAQTGDPTGSGHGGESVFGTIYSSLTRYYAAEQMPKIKHSRAGLVSMVNCGDSMLGSQFFITLGSELSSLDGEHCVFGEVTEGEDVLLKLNESICDEQHRPYQDIRITHTIILEDPFDDPPNLNIPESSPLPTADRLMNGRLAPDEAIDEMQGKTLEEIEEMVQEKEAAARATILEIVGDLPSADMAPPENVLFICKLNPVTTDDDLAIIFGRFGKVNSCEVIRDKVTGDSLQYAFIEFAEQKSCENAYFKMDNVLIDDRRIHVDFSQSVAKVRWKGKGRGVEHIGSKPGERVETDRHKPQNSADRAPRPPYVAAKRDSHNDRDRRDVQRQEPRRDDRRAMPPGSERSRKDGRMRSRSPVGRQERRRSVSRDRLRNRDVRKRERRNDSRKRSRSPVRQYNRDSRGGRDRDERGGRDQERGRRSRERTSRERLRSPVRASQASHKRRDRSSSASSTQDNADRPRRDEMRETIPKKHESNKSTHSTNGDKQSSELHKKHRSDYDLEKRDKGKKDKPEPVKDKGPKSEQKTKKKRHRSSSSSSESSSEDSSSSSEPRRKKKKTKEKATDKKKVQQAKHKKRKVESNSSSEESSDSETESRKSKQKTRSSKIGSKTSRENPSTSKKKRNSTEESSSSESDAPRKKKKMVKTSKTKRRTSETRKKKKTKDRRKSESGSDSSNSEALKSKKRKSKKSNKKTQSSESASSSD